MDFLNFNSIIDKQLTALSEQSGLGVDQLSFLFCSFVAYPLAVVYSFLPPNRNLKHIFGLVIGVWFSWICFKWQTLHSFASAAGAYLIVNIFEPKQAAKFTYIWAMGYLTASHIYRMYDDYMGYTLDFTGPQMLLTLKLTTFALDYYDGQQPVEKMKPYAKVMHVKEMPSILEFFGYVYFFPGFLAGPAFNLREYLEYIDGTMFKEAPGSKMPSPWVPFIRTFGTALLCSVLVVINMSYGLKTTQEEAYFQKSLIERILLLWLAGCLARFPYYFAWKLGEAGSILCGIGFSGMKNGFPTWERASNAHILKLELAQNFKDVTDSWNIRTDKWLKHYIYERLPVAPVALTFLNSAVWHGFYPGYYYSFMTASFIIQIARVIRRNIRPWFLRSDGVTPKSTKVYYDIASVFVTSFTLNYIMAPFVLLGLYEGWKLWSSIYFAGHVLSALVYFLAAFVIRPPKVPKKTT